MDRTFRGLIAGSIAGTAMNIWNLTDFYFLHITKLRLLDWVAVLTSGEKSQSVFQVISDALVQILWDGILGVFFAHLLIRITSNGIIIKSTLYGTLLYFIFRAVAVLFRVGPLITDPFPGRFSHLLGAILWGIILGSLLKRFDKIPEKLGDYKDWQGTR